MPDAVYWIDLPLPGRLAVSPRPRGGDWLEGDVAAWQRLGVDIVVSLLMPDESDALGLDSERSICEVAGIEFLSFPIVDRNVPSSTSNFSVLLEQLHTHLQDGKNIVIHCRQGIGRSGLVAIALLMHDGRKPLEAIQLVTKARGLPVPETQEQLAWIHAFSISKLT